MAEPDEPPRATVRREVEEEIGILKEPGALLVVAWQPSRVRNLTEPQRAAGWSERIEDGVQLVFDGGVLTPEDIAAIRLDPNEMEEFAFLPVDQAVERMAPLHARWATAAFQAREAGSATSYDALIAGVDHADLAKADIYPQIWDESDALEWVRGWFEPLVPYIGAAAQQGHALIVWLN